MPNQPIPFDPESIASRVIDAINQLITTAQVHERNLELEIELRSTKNRINILERYLEACRERPLLGPEDSPEALGGDVTILPDGTVYDTKTGIAISPNN